MYYVLQYIYNTNLCGILCSNIQPVLSSAVRFCPRLISTLCVIYYISIVIIPCDDVAKGVDDTL